MRHRSDGCAAVLIYQGGRCAYVLAHAHDGGEAYMGPLFRKAVAYAKVQYESGDIYAILRAEPDMEPVDSQLAVQPLRRRDVRHLYYLTETWDSESGRKRYGVRSRHLPDGVEVSEKDLPTSPMGVPSDTATVV